MVKVFMKTGKKNKIQDKSRCKGKGVINDKVKYT